MEEAAERMVMALEEVITKAQMVVAVEVGEWRVVVTGRAAVIKVEGRWARSGRGALCGWKKR